MENHRVSDVISGLVDTCDFEWMCCQGNLFQAPNTPSIINKLLASQNKGYSEVAINVSDEEQISFPAMIDGKEMALYKTEGTLFFSFYGPAGVGKDHLYRQAGEVIASFDSIEQKKEEVEGEIEKEAIGSDNMYLGDDWFNDVIQAIDDADEPEYTRLLNMIDNMMPNESRRINVNRYFKIYNSMRKYCDTGAWITRVARFDANLFNQQGRPAQLLGYNVYGVSVSFQYEEFK